MKVTILGAAGNMASGAIRDLAEAPEVKEIVLADLEQYRSVSEERAKRWCHDKASVVSVNINDAANLRDCIRGSGAVANCTTHHLNLQVMDACLAEGINYVDLGGLFHVAKKQLQLNDQWKKKGITAVLGMGSAPGIVNVMSRYAVDMLDSVESIYLRDGIVNLAEMDTPLAIPYALGTLLDEFMMNAFVLENGELKEVPPLSGGEVIDFPEPVGTQTVYCTIHSEEITIPTTFKSKGLKHMSFKLALPLDFENKLKFLVGIGLGDKEAINVNGTPVAPRDFLIELCKKLPRPTTKPDDHKVLRVDVAGNKNDAKLDIRMEMICHPYEPWEMGVGVHSVGTPLGVVSRLLAGGEVTEKGALPAEACIPPKRFFELLAERNLHASVMVKQRIG
ncbi:MAG: saccharopine dehydrogenase NADP-binding domain-containing protein [Deltaproteobacteria bacterium]|nr:saccharopine dehydrogenase NADP-binding domain-containing protein [Deltaproteobacteria bacterium]